MNGAIGTSWSIPISSPTRAALRDQRHHAVGGADREQVHDRRLQRDQRRVERDQQQQEREADDADDEQRHAALHVLALVLERRGDAADLGVDARAAQRPGTTSSRSRLTRSSVSLSCGEPSGITVISAASPASLIAGRATNATPGSLAEPVGERVDVGLGAAVGQLGGDDERAVGAGPEALGVEVVGLAGHRVGRVVAGVGEAEPHAERRGGQREQDQRRDDRGAPGAPLDRVAPARGGRVAVLVVRLRQAAAEERDAQTVDPSARGRTAAPAAA